MPAAAAGASVPYRGNMTTELVGDDSTPDLPDYTMVGPYRLLQTLGEGGMGVVHLALDPTGKAVALKVLRPHIAHDPDARARLAREVETLGRVRAPQVAAVIDADIDCDQPYVVTRYVPGPTLDEVVRQRGPAVGEDLVRLGRGLAEALDAIHEAGVVHRDVKPGNVLLLDGDPVLIDFGIAHVADDIRLTMTGLVMGTPGYLAPEVVEGDPVSEATDWWGWAATLAFAASGQPPFGRGPMEAVLARVGRGDADLSRVDPALAPLLEAALHPDPSVRPDERTVVAALERYAAGAPVTDVLPAGATAPATEAVPRGPVAPPADSTQALGPDPTRRLPEPEPAQWAPPPPVRSAESDRAAEAAHRHERDPYAGDPYGADRYRGDPYAGDPYAGDPYAGAVEPWQTGAAPQREGDPRIGRARRSALLAAMLVAVSAAAAVAPLVAVAAALAWSLVARTTDLSMTSLVLRRHERGRRRGDVAVGLAAGPWHLVRGLLETVAGVVLPILIGGSAAVCTALAVATVAGGNPRPGAALPLGIGMLLATLMAWWGPGGASLRRGSRSIVRGLAPSGSAAGVLAVLLLVAAGFAAGWAYLHADQAAWWPLATIPSPFDRGGVSLP